MPDNVSCQWLNWVVHAVYVMWKWNLPSLAVFQCLGLPPRIPSPVLSAHCSTHARAVRPVHIFWNRWIISSEKYPHLHQGINDHPCCIMVSWYYVFITTSKAPLVAVLGKKTCIERFIRWNEICADDLLCVCYMTLFCSTYQRLKLRLCFMLKYFFLSFLAVVLCFRSVAACWWIWRLFSCLFFLLPFSFFLLRLHWNVVAHFLFPVRSMTLLTAGASRLWLGIIVYW